MFKEAHIIDDRSTALSVQTTELHVLVDSPFLPSLDVQALPVAEVPAAGEMDADALAAAVTKQGSLVKQMKKVHEV